MKTKTLQHVLFAATLGSSAVASANAFNINEHDAYVTGRGGATAASNTDPSSVVFNPGGIPIAEGTNFAADFTTYFASGSYRLDTDPNTEVETNNSPAFVPALFLTSRISDMVAVGIGLHFPFGLALSWPTGHPQSDVIQEQVLRTYFITPSVGLNLDKQVPGLSIGAGLDIVPSTVDLKRTITIGDAQGMAHLGGTAVGVGGRVGVMYHPPAASQLKLGVMWRSDVKENFSGKGDFDIDPTVRSALPPDGDITTSITLPQEVWGGAAYDPMPDLEIEFNAVWINWSKFKDLTINLPGGTSQTMPEDYQNTVTYRAGAEYKLKAQHAAVRVGYIYDPTPIPTTTLTAQLPDSNRNDVTVGGSYYFGEYAAHLGLLWVIASDRATSSEPYMPFFKATYGVDAVVGALSFSGTFGAPPPPPPPSSSSVARR